MPTDADDHHASGEPGKPPAAGEELVVFITRHDGVCAECGGEFLRGQMIRVEKQRALCLACADLDRLEFLPRGDAALTRRATKHSALRAVVVEWSRSRQRYERQGILAPPDAIRQAETECLSDAKSRQRQRERAAVRRVADEDAYVTKVGAEIRRLYPGCPPGEAAQIAAWTCAKHSGRVGRSAAAKELEPEALRRAVVAHIRHEHTRYDELLMRFGDRDAARESVREAIERVLRAWEREANPANRVER